MEKGYVFFLIAILAVVTLISMPSIEIRNEQDPNNPAKVQCIKYRTTYTVKDGDTLSQIAKKYGVDVCAIAEINEEVSIYTENGEIYSDIQPGQVLKIPY